MVLSTQSLDAVKENEAFVILKIQPKSVLKTRKSDFDGLVDDDDDFDWSEESSQPNSATSEPATDNVSAQHPTSQMLKLCEKIVNKLLNFGRLRAQREDGLVAVVKQSHAPRPMARVGFLARQHIQAAQPIWTGHQRIRVLKAQECQTGQGVLQWEEGSRF